MPVQAVIPSAPPPPPQINPPTGIIEGYLNRIPPAVYASQQIQNSLGALAQYQQQKQARQLEALKSISDLYGAGGPQAVQQYAPTLNRVAGSNIIDTSQDQAQSGAPSYSTPGGGGGVSSNEMSAPAQPGQTVPSPSNQGQPQTIGGQLQAPGMSQQIQASLNAGHPDYTGQLARVQQKMQGFENQGKYGQTQQEGLARQASVIGQQMTAAKVPFEIQALQSKFATPDQGAAIASGDPAKIASAYGGTAPAEAYQNAATKQMEKNKAVTGEISKLSQQQTEVKTLNGMFQNLDKNLHSYYQDPKKFLGSGNIYQLTRGRAGSASGAEAINQGQPLVASLNQTLTKRFNMSESEVLNKALAPSPNDTPQYAASKMKMIHQIIQAMDTGNKDNVTAVLQAINGQIGGQ